MQAMPPCISTPWLEVAWLQLCCLQQGWLRVSSCVSGQRRAPTILYLHPGSCWGWWYKWQGVLLSSCKVWGFAASNAEGLSAVGGGVWGVTKTSSVSGVTWSLQRLLLLLAAAAVALILLCT